MTFIALNAPPPPLVSGQLFRTSHSAQATHMARYVVASSDPVGQYLHGWCGAVGVLPDHYQDSTTARVYSPSQHPCKNCQKAMDR